jgi:WD40 repeat protein/serine/threonine protein kinase
MTNDSATQRDVLERLADGFMASYRAGKCKSVEEYAAQYPELANELQELLAALVILEENAPHRDNLGRPPKEQPHVRAAPREIGDFVILREIARGGMGVVYEAVQQSLGRHVALKVLSSPGLLNPSHLERFRLEARAAARLHHTNIVPVFGVGERDGLHYYAMQFIQGQSLDLVIGALRELRGKHQSDQTKPAADTRTWADASELLTGKLQISANGAVGSPLVASTNGSPEEATAMPAEPAATAVTEGSLLPPSEFTSSQSGREFYRSVARVGLQVAEALAYAHSEGVLHRDIKPSNLLLDAKGNVWVTDFGLAKAEGTEGLTQTGDFVGTLRYMAPERLEGWSDRRSDLYSLGATLYELLTLKPFLECDSRGQLVDKILHESPTALSKLDRLTPRDLETIVHTAVAKEPASRYRTAAAMADDLRRYLKGEPIQARPIGRAERAWRWCRRNPVVASLSAGVVLSLAAMLILVSLYAVRERARALDLQENLARQYLRRGQSLCEQGDLAHGLHWLARSLTEAPPESTALKDVIRENLAGWEQQWVSPRAILEHDATLLTIALSPDGKRAVASTHGGILQFWSLETGELRPLKRQQGPDVGRIAFSPDSRRVVTASDDHAARIWDAETGTPVGVPLRHEDDVLDGAFSSDGKLVATASVDETARLWNSTTGEPISPPHKHDGPVNRVEFSLDGRRLVTAGYADGVVRFWSVPIGESIGTMIRNQSALTDVALSPDGMTVATGSDDKTARLWNANSGLPIGDPMRHLDSVRRVAFSPDGQRVLTGSADRTARLWDAKTAHPTDIVLQHQGGVLDAKFSADGIWILTGASDGAARLWDADTGELLGLPFRHTHSARVPIVALVGHTVLTETGGSEAVLWSALPSSSGGITPPRTLAGTSLAFSADGSRILALDENRKSAEWWSPKTGQLERSMVWPGELPWAIALSSDGKRAVVGGRLVSTAQIWALDDGERLLFNLPHADQVRAVAFSPDAKLLATACFDGKVRLWSAEAGQLVGRPLLHPTIVEDVSFSPDCTLVVTACGDGVARIWSVATGRQVGAELRHRELVLAASFSPDGKLVATGSRDNTARFWDVVTGLEIGSALEHRQWVEDVCFSPDSKRLATATDRGVWLWSVATGEQLGPVFDYGSSAFEVAFSPDGKAIAMAGNQGARLWTVPPPFAGKLEDAEVRMQVLTWTEMDANGVLGRLDRATWQARRAKLAKAIDQ